MNKTAKIKINFSEKDGSAAGSSEHMTNWLDDDQISDWITLKIIEAYELGIENNLDVSVNVELIDN